MLSTSAAALPYAAVALLATMVARSDPVPVGEGLHELGHFYDPRLIFRGESVKVVQDRLGHTSAQMTFGHLCPPLAWV